MKQLMANVRDSKFNDQNAGRVDFFPPISDWVDQIALSTSNDEYTVPTWAKFIIFLPQSGIDFAVKLDGVAVFPAAGITDGSGCLLNPGQLDVTGATTIGFISDATGYLSLAVYG
jgi:hypothetical protein